jgi:N-acetylglucosaminyl-diphospho-decaprenol L-rhamnosyltransferase
VSSSVDVVIPTWQGRDMLMRCLDRLQEQDVAHQVIVVDNASDDGTADVVAERHPEARLVRMDRNEGFGRAVNAGVAAGSGDYIVLINNDVEVEAGFLRAVVAPMEDDPAVGMVASLMLFPTAPPRVDCYGLAVDRTLLTYCRLRGLAPTADGPLERLAGASGGAGAYRRAAFEQVGGFDEALFAYGDDIDLALRLRTAGWAAAETRAAQAVHLGGATAGVDSPWQRDMAGFARGYGLRRYGVLRTAAGPRALVVETLVVAWGLVRHRTAVPLRSRLRGWRAGGGLPRHPIPELAVDRSITLRETLRRAATR